MSSPGIESFRPLAGCCVIIFSLLLAACSPRYDWRELQPKQDPLAMMLPAKPAVMSRSINLDGTPVTMHMHGALVDGHSFTAAWVELDEAGLSNSEKKVRREKALEAMQRGMINNIDGTVIKRKETTVRLIDASGRPVGKLPAKRLTIAGTAAGKPVAMHGVFAGFNNVLYQFVVVGQQTPSEQIKTYLDSIRIRTAKPAAVAAIL